MFFPGRGKDNNVIQIEQARLSVEAGEDMIHEAREGGRCIAKTEGDLVKFVQLSAAGTKCGLCLITLSDGHLPVPTLEVEDGEPSSPMESVEEVVYPGQWVGVFDGAAFNCRKSTQKRRLPSFFLTMTTGKAHGLLDGRVTLLASICWTCVISSR